MSGVAYVEYMIGTLIKIRKKRPYGGGLSNPHFPGKNSDAAVFEKHFKVVYQFIKLPIMVRFILKGDFPKRAAGESVKITISRHYSTSLLIFAWRIASR